MELKKIYEDSFYHDKTGMLLQGDCIEQMKKLPDSSIDMILCDLPYGTTSSKWDVIIPFENLWPQYERIIKDNGAICLTASQPFTSLLITSNLKLFKYELVWIKNIPTGFWNAKRMQMKIHENILLFYKKQPIYNPQMVKRTEEEYKKSLRINDSHSNAGEGFGGNDKLLKRKSAEDQWYKYPTTELKIPLDDSRNGKGHPNQKPVALFEYLIKTYSDENEIVLDNCAGSSTTAVACKNTNRRWICIEKEEKYCEISKNRIESWVKTQ